MSEFNHYINSLHAGKFLFLLSSAAFFQNHFSQKILSGTPSECQMVWTQIRTDILSVLIWVQTVCSGYQQMTKVAASRDRVNLTINTIFDLISARCA